MAIYKRSIFVINPKFQFKFSLFICSLIFLGTLVYPITIYELFDQFARLSPTNSESLLTKRSDLLTVLMVIQSCYLLAMFFLCIFASHKIAGPLYKLSNFLRNVAEGNTPQKLFFRKGDNFMEVADLYNQAMDRIQLDREHDFQYLKEVKAYISNLSVVVPEDKKPVIKEITSKLDEIIQNE